MIIFNGNNEPTVGIELELQVIDRTSNRLVSKADKIIRHINSPLVKYELFQSTVEINSSPTTDLAMLEKELRTLLNKVIEAGKKFDVDFVMAGTNPLTTWKEQRVTPIARYQKMIEKIKWPARIMMIFGLHIHVGVENANVAIHVCNRLLSFLPHFLALSSSSPFWGKTETGLASTRTKLFESLPLAGISDHFKDWYDFELFVQRMLDAGSIDTYRDIWWDVRPHPDFGTVEIRVFDAVPTLWETMALAALVQALVQYLSEEYHSSIITPPLTPYWLLRENKWRATRFAIDAEIMLPEDGKTSPITEEIEKLLDMLKETAEILGTGKYLSQVREIIRVGPSYKRQLAMFNGKRGDFHLILQNLKKELLDSLN
jgi:carboxylate-amine ligase